jgi:Holliday junction resolvase
MPKSRFKQYQDLVAEQMNTRLADEIKTESWKTSSVKIKRNVVNNVIKSAKVFARNKVKLDANEADW